MATSKERFERALALFRPPSNRLARCPDQYQRANASEVTPVSGFGPETERALRTLQPVAIS